MTVRYLQLNGEPFVDSSEEGALYCPVDYLNLELMEISL